MVIFASSSLAAGQKRYICSEGYTTNMRSEASTSSHIVTKLSKYTPLIVLEEQKQWTKVKTSTFQGWIYNTLLDESINCVAAVKSYKTHKAYSSSSPHKYRKKVVTGEGFRVLKTKMGMTRVKDKTGNVFWLENHVLWPKEKLKSLTL